RGAAPIRRSEAHSCPRSTVYALTHFPGVLLQPLGHLSGRPGGRRSCRAQGGGNSSRRHPLPQPNGAGREGWGVHRTRAIGAAARHNGRMSYLVLARKWRPRRFAELVGQEHVVRARGNALEPGRVHPAYLFTGTRGVGKTTIARIFAKSLNCEKGTGADPCGECETCLAIDAGRYIDLLEIDAASNTG